MGERRKTQNPEGLPRHAQLEHIQDPRRAMEGHVERGEAALLRRTVPTVQAAHGEAPGLQVPAASEADVHRGREEDAHLRVQDADAPASAGDAAAVVPGRRQRDELPLLRLGPDVADDVRFWAAVALAPSGTAERGGGTQLRKQLLLSSRQRLPRRHEFLARTLHDGLRLESQTRRRLSLGEQGKHFPMVLNAELEV